MYVYVYVYILILCIYTLLVSLRTEFKSIQTLQDAQHVLK